MRIVVYSLAAGKIKEGIYMILMMVVVVALLFTWELHFSDQTVKKSQI